MTAVDSSHVMTLRTLVSHPGSMGGHPCRDARVMDGHPVVACHVLGYGAECQGGACHRPRP